MYQVFTVPCIGDVSPLKFNAVLASIAGVLFFSGWWIMIALIAENLIDFYGFLPGFFATIGLVVVNIIPTNLIQQPNLYASNSYCGLVMIRICLLIGFMISFGALIGACYILFNDYVLKPEEKNKWPGFGIFLLNLFIFVAMLMLKCTIHTQNF